MKFRAVFILMICCCGKGHASESRLTAYLFGLDAYAEISFAAPPSSPVQARAESLDANGATQPLEVLAVEPLGGRPRMLRVFFGGAPQQQHNRVRVCFAKIKIAAQPKENLCVEGAIARDAAAAKQDALAKLASTAKTQAEKRLFASGFLHSSAAAVDLNINRGDLQAKGLQYFLRLKRATAAGADPRHAEAGFQHRLLFLARGAQQAGRVAAPIIAGYLLDLGAKVEGDSAARAVSHSLVYASLSIQSSTISINSLGLGPHSDDAPGAWLRFRVTASGFEAGAGKARIAAGADATLSLRREKADTFLRRFELHLESTARYLVRSESETSGFQSWTQAEAKAFLHETDTIRYGLRFCYRRGALPPLFVPVKSFQFGWILESQDGAS